MSVTVFIVAEIRLLAEGLTEALGRRKQIEVVGSVGDYDAAIPAIRRVVPDVVLFDVTSPSGLDAIGAIVRAVPETSIVALAVPELEADVIRCAEAGIAGYVTRDAGLDELVTNIEMVARGESLCTPRIAAILLRRVAALAAHREPVPTQRLTSRELEILALIREGMSNKEIARSLSIQVSTVKNHVHNILEKLGARKRNQAAQLAPVTFARERSVSR